LLRCTYEQDYLPITSGGLSVIYDDANLDEVWRLVNTSTLVYHGEPELLTDGEPLEFWWEEKVFLLEKEMRKVADKYVKQVFGEECSIDDMHPIQINYDGEDTIKIIIREDLGAIGCKAGTKFTFTFIEEYIEVKN
jgi:hypothetical protein